MTDHATLTPPELSVVVPLREEQNGVPHLVERILGVLAEIPGMRAELILVDDGSADGTWEASQKAAGSHADLVALRLSRSFGKEAALAAGLDVARGRAVITMDGDLEHPPELIPEMVSAWRAGGIDLVEVVRRTDQGRPRWRSLASRVFGRVFRALTGWDLRNATDFKLLDRTVVDAWKELDERGLFFKGLTAWLGFRSAKLELDTAEVARRPSRFRPTELLGLGLKGWTSFSSFPLHLTSLIGALFFVFAVVLGLQTLHMKLSGVAVTGFTTVILLLLIVGSCVLLSLGIIGIYLSRIYEEVKRRPRYLVSQRTERKE